MSHQLHGASPTTHLGQLTDPHSLFYGSAVLQMVRRGKRKRKGSGLKWEEREDWKCALVVGG